MMDLIVALGLPLAAFALMFAAMLHAAPEAHTLRRTFISAALGWGVVVFAITEILSAFGAIGYVGVLTAWLLVDGGLLALNLRLGRPLIPVEGARELWSTVPARPILAGCGLVAAITLLIAVVAPPNNWDAMTYHMARVAHWIENGNVNFYAVQYTPQLFQGPWASYATLNLMLLAHGDELVNLVQWFSFVGCALVATLVAAQLGAGRLGQAVAALAVLTLPVAILQASSAQNHLVVSFWLVCLASLALSSREGIGWRLTLEIGACLGLAIITKATAYVLAPPLLLWAGYELVRKTRWRALLHVSVAGLVAIGVNVLLWTRNFEAFGWPLGPRHNAGVWAISPITPKTFLESLIQEASLQLAVPTHQLHDRVTGAITWIAGVLHLDLNDPAVMLPGGSWLIPSFSTHEDYSANLLAFLLIIVVAGVVLLRRRGVRLAYLLAILAACALFVGYLRWEQYSSRYQLPLFVLMAPLVGTVVAEWRRWIVVALVGVLVVGSSPWLLDGKVRPIIGPRSVLTTSRTDQYFTNRPDLEGPFVAVAAAVRASGCRDVGMHVINDDPWEYPLWRLLNPADQEITLRDVEVSNETASLETGPAPCMIVFENAGLGAPQTYRGAGYRMVLAASPVYLYERAGP